MLPPRIMRLVDGGMELGHADDVVFKVRATRWRRSVPALTCRCGYGMRTLVPAQQLQAQQRVRAGSVVCAHQVGPAVTCWVLWTVP